MITEVLLDLDGVLVNFVGGAGKMYGVDLYADRANRGKWDCNEFIGMTLQQFIAPMTADFWANLDWMPDGRAILSMVEERFGKENICLLSDPSGSVKAVEGKLRWIDKHLPSYKKRYLFGPAKFFAGSPNRMLIDDSDDNFDQFAKRGFHALQVPRLWNRLHFFEPVQYVSESLNVPIPRLPMS